MGPWGIAALIGIVAVSTEAGRTYAKKLLKTSILAGYQAKQCAEEFAGKAKEYKDELIAEVKEENEEQSKNGSKSKTKSKITSS